MDQYDYLTRDQLVLLVRALGLDCPDGRAPTPDNPEGLPEFGERALRDFEGSASPMRIFDRETLRYLAVNDAAIRFYGYSREEFLALTIRDTRHPEEHAAQLASLGQSTSYIQYGGVRRQIRKSGEVVVVELVSQDVLYNGREARLALTIDITGRLQMQELLWRRQQEFESLAENLPDLVARYDRNRRFAYVNSAVEKALGFERGQIIGKTQRELGLPRDLVAQYDDSLTGVLSTGEPHKFEFELALSTGERRFEAYHVAEMDEKGGIASVLCVARDITERKQNEVAVLQGAALARLVESLARAANQALTPEDAMAACLERICRHGNWAFGRVELFDQGRPTEAAGRSIWYAPDRERFAEFIRFTTGRVHRGQGHFIGRLLREHTAVWLEDVRERSGFLRWELAVGHGLRSAFAFPVIVRGEIVAVMEVFGEEVRPQDSRLMGAAHSLASQLARIVEREWAHQANARMAAIVESSGDAIMSRTLDGRILTWNRAAERLFGYAAAEIVGRNVEILYPEELRPEIFRRQQLLVDGHEVPPLETVRLAKDGRRVHVSISPAAIHDSSGNICGISTIVQDITERKVAEQALRESERRLAVDLEAMTRLQRIGSLYVRGREMHAVLDEIVDAAIAITSADMGNIQVLDAKTGRLRIVAQRGFARAWLDFWNDGGPAAEGTCGAALEQRERVIVEDVSLSPIFLGTPALQVQLQAGVRAVQSTPLLSRSGKLVGMFSTHWKVPHRPDDRVLRLLDLLARQTADIIERTEAEMALARSEERFRQLAENIDQVFWIDTPECDGNQYVSPAFERIWGRSVESLRREPNSWWNAVYPEDRPQLIEAVGGIARGRHIDVQYRIVRPDGDVRWIRARSYPMRPDGDTPLICGLAEDITDQKLTEQRRLSDAVQQRDALVREVHHRIKNSLQGVAGLLREKVRKFPTVATDIEEAIVQLQTVAVIYGLQGARADGLLSIAELVEAICSSAEGLLGGRVDRVFEHQTPRPACVAGSEAVSVAVALNELVFNALKHQRAPAGKKRAQVALCEKTDSAEIRIINRGRLPRRFDFSASVGIRTGLGLVRTLLQSPGASVEFSGKGGNVAVLVKLRPPLLVDRRNWSTRKVEHGDAGEEKAAAAYPGRR